MKNINNLSPAQLERLAILSEELGEAQQVIGKIIRHGYESFDPTNPDIITNRRLLEKEMGDVLYALILLTKNNDLSKFQIDYYKDLKEKRITKYLHHQS